MKGKRIIEVRDLYKIYQVGSNRVHALNGVSFDIYKGEFVAVVGTSGSGKSTLLNMLAGLEPPTKGTIQIAGKRIDRMNERQLVAFRRNNVGFIFQSYNLLNTMNGIENVAMPLMFRGVPKAKREKQAAKYMKLMNVLDQAKHMPNQMSGGQQQTLVMVTHDNTLASYADKQIRIVDGKIVSLEYGERGLEIEGEDAEAEKQLSLGAGAQQPQQEEGEPETASRERKEQGVSENE